MGDFESRAWGCVLGSLCGDAAGAVLEFASSITEHNIEQAMHMPGGGVFDVGPGQITDDGELSLSLAHALADSDPAHGFPAQAVAARYAAWYVSRPFDIGNTCRAAFSVTAEPHATLATRMAQSAAQLSNHSHSNGALMRIAPLAVWASGRPANEVAAMASQDASLSHPSMVCLQANAAYCLAIWHLLHHQGDAQGAVRAAEAWVQKHAGPEVIAWVCEESHDITSLEADAKIGWVRWGLVLAFGLLRQEVSYEDGIRLTLGRKGDTDTNAAIVGGMLGALHGRQGIPEYMQQPVLAYNHSTAAFAGAPCAGHERPADLTPASALSGLMVKLIARAASGS